MECNMAAMCGVMQDDPVVFKYSLAEIRLLQRYDRDLVCLLQ